MRTRNLPIFGFATNPMLHAPTSRDTLRLAGLSAVVEHQISTEDERKRRAYHQETAAPGGREWFAIAGFWVEDRRWSFPIYRGTDRGPFMADEARRLAEIGPYLAKILSMSGETRSVRRNLQALNPATSGMRRHRCRRRRSRQTAESGCATPAGQHSSASSEGGCRARDPASNRRLQQLVLSTLRTESRPRPTPYANHDRARWSALASGRGHAANRFRE